MIIGFPAAPASHPACNFTPSGGFGLHDNAIPAPFQTL
jgi:hypothetical protein